MGYHYHTPGTDAAPASPPPAMSCGIALPAGVMAHVGISVTLPDGTRRPPTVEEWTTIIRSLVKQQITLTTHDDA